MKAMTYLLSLLAMLLIVIPCNGQSESNARAAEESSRYAIVFMKNENEYRGRIISQNHEKMVLETQNLGVFELPMREIERIMEGSEKKVMFNFGPHRAVSTRYFFGTNGFSVDKNSGYYQNTWIFLHQANYGLTDKFSLGAGVVAPFFWLIGEPLSIAPIWMTAKYAIPTANERFNLSAGVLAGRIGRLTNSGFGLLFTQATFGDNRNNFNLGMGYGFQDGQLAKRPVFSFGGILKMGQKTSFITENYLISTEFDVDLLALLGIRFYFKNLSLDTAIVSLPFLDSFRIGLPWLSITVPFGKY